jgi:hypothetical protein
MLLGMTCSGGINSTPPRETIKVLKPLAETNEQFQHGLESQLRVWALEFRMPGDCEPILHNLREFVRGHAADEIYDALHPDNTKKSTYTGARRKRTGPGSPSFLE